MMSSMIINIIVGLDSRQRMESCHPSLQEAHWRGASERGMPAKQQSHEKTGWKGEKTLRKALEKRASTVRTYVSRACTPTPSSTSHFQCASSRAILAVARAQRQQREGMGQGGKGEKVDVDIETSQFPHRAGSCVLPSPRCAPVLFLMFCCAVSVIVSRRALRVRIQMLHLTSAMLMSPSELQCCHFAFSTQSKGDGFGLLHFPIVPCL